MDGGVTVYNNPAFQMVLMATLDRYWPFAPEGKRGWKTGEKDMLVVSVGTGLSPIADELLYNASHIPSALMNAAQIEQDLLCRVFGNWSCRRPPRSRARRSDRRTALLP